MNKAHSAINWENYPSDETPLNESNLNKMDAAIGVIDDRVITLDTTKATKTEVATLVADVTFEESTGIITITKKNGSKITIDTQMEKIAINFDYNPTTQQIILTLIDGTKQYIDLSALITQYEFLDSDTVAFYIDKDGKVSAIVKEGSIEEKHLEPNYLAKIKVEVAKAESSMKNAATSENNAASSATKAQSYAVGGTGSREGEDSDNAKYYYEQVKDVSEAVKGGLQPRGTVAFVDLPQLADVVVGWMFNVSDEFTTTADFKEGVGNVIPAGANIYKTSDGKWDVLAGTLVTGIKGAKEKSYRRGNVDLTAANIGAVAIDGDTAENTTAFSAASTRENLKSGEKHNILFGKIVKWFADLKTVAFSGSYNDLSNKPTIPAAVAVKGNAETAYRTGNVNITPANMGLGNVNNTADKDKSVAYARDTAGVIAGAGDVRVGFSGDGVNFRTYNKAGTAAVNGYTNLGSGSYRWKQLFATTATISTSDRNLKKDIHQLTDTHLDFFLKLQPVSFLFKDGESGRTHIGFIAQDVEQAMSECGLTDLDFAGFCKDQKVEVFFEEDENGDKIEKERPILDENGNPEYIYSLRYEEFIALNTYVIQELWKRVDAVEKENIETKNQIKSMQQDIAELKKSRT